MILSNKNKENLNIDMMAFIKELETYFKMNHVRYCYLSELTEENKPCTLFIGIKDTSAKGNTLNNFFSMKNYILSNGYDVEICFGYIEPTDKTLLYSYKNGINYDAIKYPEEQNQINQRITFAKKSLYDLREDATRLLNNIDSALEHIDEIKTEEDMYDFIKNHEIEDGLEYIDIDI